MTQTANHTLPDAVRDILAGPHLSVLTTTSPDGEPQTSVIFVTREGDTYPPYATVTGRVDLVDDRDGSFHQVMYDIHMGGATPPPEQGADVSSYECGPTRSTSRPTTVHTGGSEEGERDGGLTRHPGRRS
jgi:hypothetical protein